MNNVMISALLFLTNTLLNLFIMILIIRLLLALAHTNYFHPITQFIVKCSNWLIKPTRKILPNIKNLETASVLWIIIIAMLKVYIVNTLTLGTPSILGTFVLAIGESLSLLIQIYTFAIIIFCLLSFVQPHAPANYILQQFTSPIMQPIRRVIPPVGGFDIAPIPAIILLQLLTIVVVNPIIFYGIGLAY